MSKISVIIPTMQKSLEVLFKLLYLLQKDESVSEIIIIDNACKGLDINSELSKVRVIIPQNNLYVNPSWNLGVKEAKEDFWTLFNDDVIPPENFCSNVLKLLSKDIGILGINTKYVENVLDEKLYSTIQTPKTSKIKLKKVSGRTRDFGIIMFGHKNSYYEIPQEMLIWCGDDYLFKMNKDNNKQNYIISGQKIKHLHSLTSNSSNFSQIKDNDLAYFKKFAPELDFGGKKTWLNQIFAVKNGYIENKKYKTIVLFGKEFYLK